MDNIREVGAVCLKGAITVLRRARSRDVSSSSDSSIEKNKKRH